MLLNGDLVFTKKIFVASLDIEGTVRQEYCLVFCVLTENAPYSQNFDSQDIRTS